MNPTSEAGEDEDDESRRQRDDRHQQRKERDVDREEGAPAVAVGDHGQK